MMIRPAILLVVVAAMTSAQLNFEGNPLTDNNEYTAEESQTSGRSSRQEVLKAERPQKLFPITNGTKIATGKKQVVQEATKLEKSVDHKANKSSTSVEASNGTRAESARQFQRTVYGQHQQTSVNPADLALNNFLHSKTPEESRLSLDYYLRNQLPAASAALQPIGDSNQHLQRSNDQLNLQFQSKQISDSPGQVGHSQQFLQSHLPQQQQQQHLQASAQVIHRPQMQTSHVVQQQQYLQPATQNLQQQQFLQPAHQAVQQQQYLQTAYQNAAQQVPSPHNPHAVPNNQPYVGLASTGQVVQPMAVALPQSIMHQRADFIAPMGWRQRTRRIRGPHFSMAQSRIGPGYYKGPIPAPLKHKAPVEVIYTRPPGFHPGPSVASNPPVPYEDASAWFPDADHPPAAKDVYYSQLYAQSYDPHYYNYIAKTGKIKPWLYGKFDKHQEEGGIWAELYRGFKKHGLKNMMSPGFLLGMTIPTAIALMFTAFVQKRSLARSDSREFPQESAIEEYFERIQKAVECYERKNSKSGETGVVDGC